MAFFTHPFSLAILIILVFESALFSHQMLDYFARPHEKKRLWHAILIGLLIPYNIFQNLIILPDPTLPLSITAQNIMGNVPGYFISAYMPLYCYKTMNLPSLKWHARYGWMVILAPALYFFFYYYPHFGDILKTRRYVYIVPAIYASMVLFTIAREIVPSWWKRPRQEDSNERTLIFLAVICWSASPLLGAYLELPRWILGIFTNTIFLILNILIMRKTVRRYRGEYNELQLANFSLSERVKERTRELENAIEQKANAYSNLIHETKTPLTLINNYLEDYINKGHHDDLLLVKENLNKINKDINNLFDLERFGKNIASGASREVVNFSRLVSESLRLFKCYCAKKNIHLTDHVEEDLLIKCDPNAATAIVNNLIENAIKYTDEGGHIEVLLQAIDHQVLFQVSDDGIGIDPVIHDKIFEPYYQITHPKTNYRGGMGIGLPLVKKIVDSLGGEIVLQSEPDDSAGTQISILLNRHRLLPAEGIVPRELIENYPSMTKEHLLVRDTSHPDTRKPTLLVVEDNYAMLNYLASLLATDYNVFIALNGKEALDKIRNTGVLPDLIVSDIMMDKMDGFELAEALNNAHDLKHIPLIFLSAKYTDEDIARGLKLGAIDFIQKPFKTGELLLKVSSILQNMSQQRLALFQNVSRNIGARERELVLSVPTVPDPGSFERNCHSYHLSKREVDIAGLVCEGKAYKEIAGSLFIAESTVKKHIENIFFKTDSTNKVQLINKLMRGSI